MKMEYTAALAKFAAIIAARKSETEQKVTLVAIEGLSNSGKSTLAQNLEMAIHSQRHHAFVLEGDKFHVGKEKAMRVYRELIDDVRNGGKVPEDFPERIWRFDEIREQVISPIERFNANTRSSQSLNLHHLLTNKADGSDHEEKYSLTRDTTILMPSMFLRGAGQFDYIVQLDITPQTSVQRKIVRDKRIGYARDPQTTRDMVELLELHAIQRYHAQHPISHGVIVDMNDYGNISFRTIP